MSYVIITISRQYGSGGRKIGHLLAESLGIPCYDRSIIDQAAKISELSPDFIEKNEQHVSNDFFFDVATTSKIYKAQADVIREVAKQGSCVIVGRCADKVLEQDYPCLKVFLYADFDKRCRRAVAEYGKPARGIEALVKKTDKGRERYFRLFHEREWKDATNYNLCLDTNLFGAERTVDMIRRAYLVMSEGGTE